MDDFESEIDSYFKSQLDGGGTIEPYIGSVSIRGRGFSGLLNSLLRFASPLVRKAVRTVVPVAKNVGKQAVGEISKAGLNTLADTLEGKDSGKAAQEHIKKAVKRTAKKLHKTAKRPRKDIFS